MDGKMVIKADNDFTRLKRFFNSSELIKSKLLSSAAQEAKALILLGFRTETDPFGMGWEPLKSRKGRILQRTGRLRNSYSVHETVNGFSVGTNCTYATYHQNGTDRIPQRMMVPNSGELTPKWINAIYKAMQNIMNKLIIAAGGKV
jgi:phage gpG-like protein